jgi:integrase
MEERLREVNSGSGKPESSMTFESFVETQWKVLALPNFKASTQHGYKTVLNAHVLPAWRTWRLREIERVAIQQWVAGQFRKGIGWQTLETGGRCSRAFSNRSRIRLSAGQPGSECEVPDQGGQEEAGHDCGQGLQQVANQLEEPYRTMVSLIAATGLRIGELLALRWTALDLDNGTLAGRESVFEGTFQPPKTQRAMRTIPLGPQAVQALQAHRAGATRTASEDLVFGRATGHPFRESKMLTRVLQPAAEAAGLGKVTWHQFRHIHSSLMSDLKVPVKIAQEQLGHASISTTLNIYAHTIASSHREAVVAVEGRLFSNVLELPDAPESVAVVSGSEDKT